MFQLLICFFLLFAATAAAESNFTVTDEAWFEIEVKNLDGPGEHYRGKFTIALFRNSAPMTVMNFVAITKGYKTKNRILHYKGTPIHRIVPDFVIQMGDVTTGDGTGGASIYGPKFNDEPFILSHRSPGWVAMANHGADTNGSQFYILLTKARWLDGKHVVFGKVVKGHDVIRNLGEVPTDHTNARPKKQVRIVDCGVTELKEPYELKPSELDSTEDL